MRVESATRLEIVCNHGTSGATSSVNSVTETPDNSSFTARTANIAAEAATDPVIVNSVNVADINSHITKIIDRIKPGFHNNYTDPNTLIVNSDESEDKGEITEEVGFRTAGQLGFVRSSEVRPITRLEVSTFYLLCYR